MENHQFCSAQNWWLNEIFCLLTIDYFRGESSGGCFVSARLRQTALMFLAERETEQPVRFDVIEIYAPQGMQTRVPQINHLEDAFQ